MVAMVRLSLCCRGTTRQLPSHTHGSCNCTCWLMCEADQSPVLGTGQDSPTAISRGNATRDQVSCPLSRLGFALWPDHGPMGGAGTGLQCKGHDALGIKRMPFLLLPRTLSCFGNPIRHSLFFPFFHSFILFCHLSFSHSLQPYLPPSLPLVLT